MLDSHKIFYRFSAVFIFVLAGFLVIHAWHSGITIDEAASYMMYVNEPWGQSWIAFTHTNTLNNHVLNSFAIKIIDLFYPWHEFAMRIPNLVAFLIYSAAVYFATIRLPSVTLKIFALLVFFSNPFALEYFSLARGYGLALAFEATALFFAMKLHIAVRDKKTEFFALFFAGFCFSVQLSIWANFAFVFSSVAIFLVVAFYYFWQFQSLKEMFVEQIVFNKYLMAFSVLTMLPLFVVPIKMLRARDGDVMTGNNAGFLESVLGSTFDQWFLFIGYSDWLAIAFTVLTLFVIGASIRRNQYPIFSIIFLSALILIFVVSNLMGTPYPGHRFALFMFPIVAFVVCEALALVTSTESQKLWGIGMPLIGGILVFNLVIGISYFFNWQYRVQETRISDAIESYKYHLAYAKNVKANTTPTLCFNKRYDAALFYEWRFKKRPDRINVLVKKNDGRCSAHYRCKSVPQNNLDLCWIENTDGQVIAGVRKLLARGRVK